MAKKDQNNNEKKEEKKPFNKKFLIFAIIFLIVVAVVTWLLIRSSGNNQSGQVEGVKEEAVKDEEKPKTVPESKYFSENAKIMYFYSDGCHWCQEQKEILGQLGYEGYRFKPIDVMDTSNAGLMEEYGIMGTPTFAASPNVQLPHYADYDELKAWLNKNGGKPTK